MINIITNTNTQMQQETILWQSRANTAGGTFAWNSVAIANTLIRQLKSKTYYRKITYLLPFLGNNLASAIIPLIDKNNAGAPTNTNFVNSDFSQSAGLTGNTTNKSLVYSFTPAAIGTNSNGGMGIWVTTFGLNYAIGMFPGGSAVYAMGFFTSGGNVEVDFYWGVNTNSATITAPSSIGHYYGNRSSSTSRTLSKNGVQVAINTTSDTASLINGRILTSYRYNDGTGSGGGWYPGTKGLEYFTDGTLTSDEISDFHITLANYLMGPTGRI